MAEQTQGTTSGLSVQGLPAWQLARRERIVEAGLHLLESQEYDRIQIRDVAQEAGVALGTLYRYFSSKEHLYAAVLLEWSALGRTGERRAKRGSAERHLRSRIRGVITAFERQPQFYKVQVLLQSSTDPNAKALLSEFAEAAQVSLVEDFAVLGPGRAEDAATMMWAIIHSMLTQAIHHGVGMSEVYRIADGFIDLLADDLR
ncbi:TetR/AcrR family transcriptional regulator [Cryptosporangium aurantiacum]|uniref:Transcriptional regulator, TetR family n=1 Tax=Cryptosporangium aurantiacum TaxID=134849 RepID=A0A1M7RK11_9ACTN|nr:TetR/AcrR family transcriptional regulator [Cryptosporangium aurantiacum]SHN46604.1 transcriptional regulator, TetR family [Cryptosporangium aurantiacum]